MVRRKLSPRSNRRSDRASGRRIETFYKDQRKSRVLQEIRHLRSTTKFLIPKLCFMRVVKDILIDIFPSKDVMRIQARALEALQEAAETYIVQFFEDAVLLTLHAKRITLMQNDMILMRRLRGRGDVINK